MAGVLLYSVHHGADFSEALQVHSLCDFLFGVLPGKLRGREQIVFLKECRVENAHFFLHGRRVESKICLNLDVLRRSAFDPDLLSAAPCVSSNTAKGVPFSQIHIGQLVEELLLPYRFVSDPVGGNLVVLQVGLGDAIPLHQSG